MFVEAILSNVMHSACLPVQNLTAHLLCCHAGNLYVTRYADGKIVLLSPSGATLNSYQLPFAHITNLELGGPDGKTLVAVGGCGPKKPATKGCVQTLRVDKAPGRAWSMLQQGLPKTLG